MTPKTHTSTLQDHLAGTYITTRIGIGVIGAALPLLLWLGGLIWDGESLRSSMSAYYYSPAMGDTFVGALVTIGVFLVLYKGFSMQEDWVLNLAGALAVGVAMVPTSPTPGGSEVGISWHGTFAVSFFICIAYICVFRASDTLTLVRDTRRARRLRRIYRLLGLAMLASPLIAVAFTFLFRSAVQQSPLVFFLEAVAVWVFAAYWLVKSQEMKDTRVDRLALEGKIRVASKMDTSQPGRLVQIEPDVIESGDWRHVTIL